MNEKLSGPRDGMRLALRAAFAAGTLLAATSAGALSIGPAFNGTVATEIGVVQPGGWTVATAGGGYNDGWSGFDRALNNGFGSAYYWGMENGAPTIANNATGSNGGIGRYTYFVFRQSFDLTGFDAANAVLRLQWACDDVPSSAVGWTPKISINGSEPMYGGTCGAYQFGSTVELTGFTAGVNRLDFFVEGNGQTDGLGVKVVEFVVPPGGVAVPEPSTLALLGLGLLGAGLAARRARR